jgi:anhydro-N-acetylmuramic acid kinase
MRTIIGLMSGTSADGVTAALVQVSGIDKHTRLKVVAWNTYPYDYVFRSEIFKLFSSKTGTVDNICRMNFAIGEEFAKAATRLMRQSKLSRDNIDLIASHGQTIYHILMNLDLHCRSGRRP